MDAGIQDFAHAGPADAQAGDEEDGRQQQGGDALEALMPVGVLPV